MGSRKASTALLESTLTRPQLLRLYLRGIDADPIVEAFYQGLMRCYQSLGRHTEAIAAYRRLRQTLSMVLSLSPSAESQALYRSIMEACAGRPESAEESTVVPLPRRGGANPARTSARRNRG